MRIETHPESGQGKCRLPILVPAAFLFPQWLACDDLVAGPGFVVGVERINICLDDALLDGLPNHPAHPLQFRPSLTCFLER